MPNRVNLAGIERDRNVHDYQWTMPLMYDRPNMRPDYFAKASKALSVVLQAHEAAVTCNAAKLAELKQESEALIVKPKEKYDLRADLRVSPWWGAEWSDIEQRILEARRRNAPVVAANQPFGWSTASYF